MLMKVIIISCQRAVKEDECNDHLQRVLFVCLFAFLFVCIMSFCPIRDHYKAIIKTNLKPRVKYMYKNTDSAN